ncbi:MAG: metal-dependent hydrolase [Candidatus Njordarchaeales archaeon]
MPFTPFHLGPALLIALVLLPYIDIVAICLGAIIPDIEPAYYLLFTDKGPYHGFFHSFVGATILGVISAIVLYPLRKQYLWIIRKFGLEQSTNMKKITASAFIGTYSHIILDMFLYPEMKPFYPIQINPFLYALSPANIYGLCTFSFILALIVYLIRLFWKRYVS